MIRIYTVPLSISSTTWERLTPIPTWRCKKHTCNKNAHLDFSFSFLLFFFVNPPKTLYKNQTLCWQVLFGILCGSIKATRVGFRFCREATSANKRFSLENPPNTLYKIKTLSWENQLPVENQRLGCLKHIFENHTKRLLESQQPAWDQQS